MKKYLIGITILGLLTIFYAFNLPAEDPKPVNEETITWYSWEEGIELAQKDSKKLFVDVYTDWCGWCKRMDATTFTDPAVIKYMNENYYAVKFNAEQKEDIEYQGHTLKYVPNGRRGYHELAVALLNGQLSYPNFVYLDEEQRLITRSPGYKKADALVKELKYIGEDIFKNKSYQDYLKDK